MPRRNRIRRLRASARAKVRLMNRLSLLTFAVALAGCGAPPNEVFRTRDGVLQATTTAQAAAYCQKDRSTLRVMGKAPAESGVLFVCDR
jgi:starvation-inducible outer membrane lipoprotein